MRPCLDPIMMGVEMRSCCNFAFFLPFPLATPRQMSMLWRKSNFQRCWGFRSFRFSFWGCGTTAMCHMAGCFYFWGTPEYVERNMPHVFLAVCIGIYVYISDLVNCQISLISRISLSKQCSIMD